MLHQAVRAAVEHIAHLRVGQVEFRHLVKILPTLVAAIGLEAEPVALVRVAGLRRTNQGWRLETWFRTASRVMDICARAGRHTSV